MIIRKKHCIPGQKLGVTAVLAAILFTVVTHNSGVSFAHTSSNVESSICIDGDEAPAHIQFKKGQVDYLAAETGSASGNPGSALADPDYPIAAGDMIYTGTDGFVSIILANGSYRNIQPDSLVTVRTSSPCQGEITPERISIDIPYLNAAIRG